MKIIFNSNVGFFESLTWALHAWHFGDLSGDPVYVVFNGPYGQNWFDKYFEQTPVNGGKIKTVSSFKELGWPTYFMNRLTASARFIRHAVVRPSVLSETDCFDVNSYVGAHYRGTDFAEAKPVSFEKFVDHVDRIRDKCHYLGTFFATDVKDLVLDGYDVVQRKDSFRSDTKFPIHKSNVLARCDTGMDAIVNCILLSRCKVIVRTRSRLSAWAGIFNPSLEINTVNDVIGKVRFPEEER
jgi:hypothetical protein